MSRILIIGPDGSGKDTLARLIRDQSDLRYPEPTSLTWAREVPAWQDGRDIKEWWTQRRQHREEWIDQALRLRMDGGSAALANICFQSADIYTGLRTQEELLAVLAEVSINLVVWCWNSGQRTLHGIDMVPELSAELTLSTGTPWIVAQSTIAGADRVMDLLTGGVL